jgi:hypothetical protein
VATATLESLPTGATHGTRSSMAERGDLSPSTVGRVRRRFDFNPHIRDGSEISTDPVFMAKVLDVIGL